MTPDQFCFWLKGFLDSSLRKRSDSRGREQSIHPKFYVNMIETIQNEFKRVKFEKKDPTDD